MNLERKNLSETEEPYKSSDVEMIESEQTTRISKYINIKKEKSEMKKHAQELQNIVMQNKALGAPPPKEDKQNKYTSSVWAPGAFHFKIHEGKMLKSHVVCGQCNAVLIKHSGTTNMMNHLKTLHSQFWREINGEKDQQKVTKYFETPKTWRRGSFNALKYDKFLARFVVKNNLCLSIVEDEWLQKLCVQTIYYQAVHILLTLL